MKDKYYTDMQVRQPMGEAMGLQAKIELPNRCCGVIFVFETKKAAVEFLGKKVPVFTLYKALNSKGEGK